MKKSKSALRVGILIVFTFLMTLQAPDLHASAQTEPGRIVFVSNRDGNDEIYVMNADGSGQTNLSNNPARDYFPAWSPDGSKIAFVSERDGNTEIYVMNADSTDQTKITNHPTDDYLKYIPVPVWSPTGKQIAYTASHNQKAEIFIMNADGSGSKLLMSHDTDYFILQGGGLKWSPDGKQIAFGVWGGSHSGNFVNLVNVDSGKLTPLTNGNFPDWSPNGSHIAFVGDAYYDPGKESYDDKLTVIKSDGSEKVLLFQSKQTILSPSWSPDGKQIAYILHDNNQGAIYVMSIEDKSTVMLTDNSISFYSGGLDWTFAATQDIAPIIEPLPTEIPTQAPVEPIPTEPPTQAPVKPASEIFTFTGHVSDGHGNPLPGVHVILADINHNPLPLIENSKEETNEIGDYVLKAATLPSNIYWIEVRLETSQQRRQVLYGAQKSPVWVRLPVSVSSAQLSYQQNVDFTKQDGMDTSLSEADRLDDLAAMYFHVSEADNFIQTELAYTTYQPVKSIWAWAPDHTGARYDPTTEEIQIFADDSAWEDQDRPMNREWHETFHHLMLSKFGIDSFSYTDTPTSHGGWQNTTTQESWVEGWATFWPCVMQEDPFYKGTNFWIEYNYKSWSTGYYLPGLDSHSTDFYLPREDYAVAGLLWDLVDTSLSLFDQDGISIHQKDLFNLIANPVDQNGKSVITIHDLYVKLKSEVEAGHVKNTTGELVSLPALDQIFIAHGFFWDNEWNQPHNILGHRIWFNEEVGWGGQPERPSVPYQPNAYLQINWQDEQAKGQSGLIQVEFIHEDPAYNHSYSVDFSALPALIYVEPLPEDVLALMRIQIQTSQGESGLHTLDTGSYLKSLEQASSGYARSLVISAGQSGKIQQIEISSNESTYVGKAITFAATSDIGNGVSYIWDFGDGSSAEGQLTNHVYTAPDDYTVTVTARNSLGSVTQTKTISVAKNETASQSPLNWIQENMIWVVISVTAFGSFGLLLILLFMRRRKFALARTGIKDSKPLSKQPTSVNNSAVVSAPPINQPAAPSAPVNYNQQVNTAIELSKAGRHQESYNVLREVVKVDANNAQAWLFLGVALVNMQDYVNAEKCLKRAKALSHPQADQALNWLVKKRDGL